MGGPMLQLTRRAFLCASAAAAAASRADARAARRIDERGFVRIGGIEQWIAIQGDDTRNPVVVYLHGGPAEAQSPFLFEFRPWEHDYTVVNWDQRGSGKTYERNGAATPGMTVERMTLDALEVAEYARRRLGKEKVILAGQSWGCVLGVYAAVRRPDLFSAYVGTGQPVNWVLSLEGREAFARSQMRAAHDTAALKALDAVSSLPPNDVKRLAPTNHWRWAPSDRRYLELQRAFISASPPSAKADVAAWMAGGGFSGPKLWPAITAFDARRITTFRIPVFVIQGRDDHVASFAPAKAWVASLQAPAKRFIAIDGGHFACFTDAPAFVAALQRYVRPFAA